MAGSLSGNEVAQFRRDGFLFPRRVFSRDEAASWRSRFESVEARSAMLGLPRPFADYARTNFNVVSVAAAELARHPALLDLVEPILGPNVLCWMSELIIKEPRTDRIVTMHQDGTYWGLEPLDHLVSVWVALSDVLEATGAMRFIRGSHLVGQLDHTDTYGPTNMLSRGQRVDAAYWADDEVPVELAPGEASLHHGLMVHGSGPNITGARRVGIVFRYVSPHVRQAVGSGDFAMTCRGDNTTHNLEPLPAPERDFGPAELDRFERIVAVQSEANAAGATEPLSYLRGADRDDVEVDSS